MMIKHMTLLSKKSLTIITLIMIFSLLTFDATLLLAPKTQATNPCNTNTGIVTDGLITAKSGTNIGNTVTGYTSPCGINSDYAGFPSDLMTSYQKLKDQYYTRAASGTTSLLSINGGGQINGPGTDHVLLWNSDLTLGKTGCPGCADSINGNPSYSYVIFVDGDLNIENDILSSGPKGYTKGSLVFIVNGNINIKYDPTNPANSVHEIDASLIAQGQDATSWAICDTYDFTVNNCITPLVPDPVPAAPIKGDLNVFGSVINLNTKNNSLQFKRTLLDNTNNPAEYVETQAKDLVNLKDILSTTLSIQTQL